MAKLAKKKPAKPRVASHLVKRFMDNVELLVGALHKENPTDRGTRLGGLWDEVVHPRPSIAHPDFTAEDRGIVQVLGPRRAGWLMASKASTLATFVDFDQSKRENYGRISQYGVHLDVTKCACIGTKRHGGARVVVGAKDRRRGEVVDNYQVGDSETKPYGISRRLDRERGNFCLVTGWDPNADEMALAANTVAMLQRVKDGDFVEGFPQIEVVTACDGSIKLRAHDESFCGWRKSGNDLNKGIRHATQTGQWGILDVQGMVSDMVGQVEAVSGFAVDIKNPDTGEMKSFVVDPAAANAVARQLTGYELPYMQAIVRPGQKVMPGTGLFGPWMVSKLESENDVPGLCYGLGGDLALVTEQIRAWYILTQARRLPSGKMGFPVDFVVPKSIDDIWLRVDERPHVISGPAEDQKNVCKGMSRVRNKLRAPEREEQVVGFAIDLYNTSCRLQMIKDITAPKPKRAKR